MAYSPVRLWSPLVLAAVWLLCGSCSRQPFSGFSHPESVIHDIVDDCYLVSNVVGEAMARDGLGSISRIDPTTMAVDHQFIVGGQRGVELHGPKGMAIVGDVLFVADIDHIRRFDRRSGQPLGSTAVPGARALNGMCNDALGNVYVGDPAWTEKTEPTGGDSIWRMDSLGILLRLGQGVLLGEPNGMLFLDGRLHWVSWADGALRQFDAQGQLQTVAKLPHRMLDGVVTLVDGSILYSSWETGGIHVYHPERQSRLLTKAHGCAGFGIDRKRRLLLLPNWYAGSVRQFELGAVGS